MSKKKTETLQAVENEPQEVNETPQAVENKKPYLMPDNTSVLATTAQEAVKIFKSNNKTK